jgi:hypothetical protein
VATLAAQTLPRVAPRHPAGVAGGAAPQA